MWLPSRGRTVARPCVKVPPEDGNRATAYLESETVALWHPQSGCLRHGTVLRGRRSASAGEAAGEGLRWEAAARCTRSAAAIYGGTWWGGRGFLRPAEPTAKVG